VRVRQHVNPLEFFFEQFRGVAPVLDPARELEVEIGCADAQFLFERAARNPERQYVGLEIREDFVDIVNERAAETKLPVTAVFCQAQLHLPLVFGAAKAQRVFINFPDPWFKRAHKNRRMVDPVLIAGVAELMAPGGELFVQTDVWELAIDALSAIESDEHFANRAGEWTFWKTGNPYGVRSWREQNAEDTGLPIWRLLYDRIA
jgi:tRNA (guanine-N7-)-methyltransferase